jgi:arsenate reductase-like glutaredoxin family protein
MAEAVENSFCVLICITEKYRQSINCQAEAQYAFKLNKPIIPLIMQKGYENVTGWLGIIMGDKIFINFTKYEFEECLRRLSNEIVALSPTKKAQVSTRSSIKAIEPKIKEINGLMEQMNESSVKEWLETNKIDSKICDYLCNGPCDGEVLLQLYEIKKRSPEFYDQSLRQIEGLSIISIARFSAALEKLFRN